MVTDAVTDAVVSAVAAVADALPSQHAVFAVSGERREAGGVRPIHFTISAVFTSNGLDDPLSNDSAFTDRQTRTILFPKCGDGGWYETTPPRPGDVFTNPCGVDFAATNIEERAGAYYRVTLRQSA